MFTGLVESLGRIHRRAASGGGLRLDIEVDWVDDETPLKGDSIAVNGACLTALNAQPALLSADVSPETLRCTVLNDLRIGDRVNLERALRLGDRVGGHLVLGHIDAIVRLLSIRSEQSFSRWTLSLPSEIAHEVARKGSVALNGVSLTVAEISPDTFDVALIPETLRSTTLGNLKPGSSLHLETDVIAKYIGRHISCPQAGGQSASLIDSIFGEHG